MILQSRLVAWLAFVLVIIVLIFTFSLRASWWAFFDIFFAFMMMFCHLIAVYSRPKLPAIGKQMDFIAGIFGILAVLSFIAEYIAWQIIVK